MHKIINIGVTSDDLNWPELRGGNPRLLSDGQLELFPFRHGPSRVLRQYGKGESFEQKGRALHWRCAGNMSDGELLSRVLACIATDDIYVTVDKDVLAEEDAAINWEQGQMRVELLIGFIWLLGKRRRVIGADVTGDFSTPHYPGSTWTRLLKHGKLWIDRARRPFTVEGAAERKLHRIWRFWLPSRT